MTEECDNRSLVEIMRGKTGLESLATVRKRHFKWSADGIRIIGLTVCGRATVVAYQLNNLLVVNVRREWVKAGWHPPADDD